MQIFTMLFSDGGTAHEFLTQALGVLRSFRLSDALDMLLVTFLLYQLIKLLRDTRAVQLAKGIMLIAVVYGVTLALDMNASGYFFGRLWDSAIVVLFLIFQPEIRHAVETMGRSGGSNILRLLGPGKADDQRKKTVRKVAIASAKAAVSMSSKKIGALIVFERKTMLGDIAKTGTRLEAKLSAPLLRNIFFPKAPLHDGALIVRDDIIYSAGCVLPLTANQDLPESVGMRHRAALGISEQSDAVVLVVSEESGNISLAREGTLKTGLNEAQLREELIAALDRDPSETLSGGYAAKKWREFWTKKE